MKTVTFVTGNSSKANNLSKFLGVDIPHAPLDLEEIQSLDLLEVVKHKALQAYSSIKTPVVIEDTSLEFHALNKLPGTFVKFFLQELGPEKICRLLDGMERNATARSMFGYYDGTVFKSFSGSLSGIVAKSPSGSGGYGWDVLFIPQGYNKTLAASSIEDYERAHAAIKPFAQLKEFISAED